MKRLSTGLADLDLILGGGLQVGSVVVLAGPPGAGKTILAQQICFTNATAEHKAIYYTTLSEPHSKMVEHLRGFTFFDPAALGPKIEYVHLGDLLRDSSAKDLNLLIDEVVRRAFDDEPVLVVIDSSKMLRDFVSGPTLRRAFYDLSSRVAHTGAVLLLLGEYTAEEMQSGVEFSLADGIIQLSHLAREPIDRRGLRVVKMRAATHLSGTHTVYITTDGVQVYPRVESFLPEETTPLNERIPSGLRGLDALMGGGIPRGDATLVLGPSGAGKTIGCLNFIAEGLTRGERCLYISFQDTANQLVEVASAFGTDFAAARDRDQLMISHVPMGSLDLDVLASVMRHRLADRTTSRVVIDSLAEMAYAARESERFPAYLRSLVAVVRAAGASLWVTSETTTFGPMKDPVVGLMFLFHNVVHIRYIEHCAEIGRTINVLKMRGSRHDQGIYECDITGGISVGGRLQRTTGMLGWSALRDCPFTGHEATEAVGSDADHG
ncbi:ATPase domain-containing protein [Actinoplanes regularis]|uniref:non-specific serine/threonine protein kinase n=1 Tax=Actinoplanes regularis TaxID=52697 RepID=A0A239EP79_9ACTN|nr:ATPase domain-containing protein [Actinoplanes regularis]GIE89850.1 serine/threonine protein kinase [Actinoplanes regularis]SNS46476.1 circadian clock protein KaiC [Actinoplanes regularis]